MGSSSQALGGIVAAGSVAGRSTLPYDWPCRDISSFVDAGGLRWHVQRTGSGPGLLLIHGTAASTHTWREMIGPLSRRFEVVAMDLPGHGFSGRPADGSMGLDAMAAAMGKLAERLEFRPDAAVGHSAGAAIALRLALDAAIRPVTVVGLNAALLPFGGAMQKLFSPLAQMFANTQLMPKMLARRARDPRTVARVIERTGSKLDRRGVDLYQRLLMREPHLAAVLAMMAQWNLEPLLEELAGLDARLHLVTAARDRAVSPREADTVARLLPGTEVTRLGDCGHLVHEEQPQRIADLIVDLCRRDGVIDDA